MEAPKPLGIAGALAKTLLTPLERPDRFPRALAAMAPWGTSFGGLVAGAAARYPDRIAIHDDAGSVTYRELWRRAQSIAGDLLAGGVGPGTTVGLLGRNHRGFVEALAGIAATGADVVLLNTGFAGPQLADVVESEHISVVIHDDEFTDAVAGSGAERTIDESELARIATTTTRVAAQREAGRMIILTSGTTGRPKGAARETGPSAIEGIAALLDRIPLRLGDTQAIAAPLFHAWGLSHLLLGIGRCTTNLLARRFDPATTMVGVARHRARVLVVVPVMLSRIMASDDAMAIDTPSLRVIASSGSAISGQLVTDVLDHFGPVLYNLYGSTEVAVASIAGPDELRRDPTTAGRPVNWVDVAIVDDDGTRLPDGETGRIFVGGAFQFDGYTNGDDKERLGHLVSSGDVGQLRDGLLFVEGRDDDMIVSGGENVFPSEVEELLHAHEAIADVAVVGVPDDEFGQVLVAFVVKQPGARLSAAQVRDHVKANLARHKVPRRVTFLDELPRNATGKVLRRELTVS